MKIIPREQHSLSRKNISHNALKVLDRLNRAGFDAYLVGGCVRDLLLGNKPKDFDITTNATPEQMRKIFRNCRLVGRRFFLIHVIFVSEIIEVSTFRGYHQENYPKNTLSEISSHGMLLRDNIFGSIEEDAHRRDFSVNSLYFNVTDFTLRDYTGGLKDLQEGTIRIIGEPEIRYREDPVRMLRAVRFAAQLNMNISHETAEPIPRMAKLLSNVPSPRLFEESLKLLQTGYGNKAYHLLCKYKLFHRLFPLISHQVTNNSYSDRIITLVLSNNDIQVNPALLFAAMLWYPLLEHANQLTKNSIRSYFDSFSLAINDVLDEQCRTLAIPKRLTALIRNIWYLQIQFSIHVKTCNTHNKLIANQKFSAASDLLSLRAEVENNTELQNHSNIFKKISHDCLKISYSHSPRKRRRTLNRGIV